MLIYIVIDALSIKLELVPLLIDLCISLDNHGKHCGELLKPGALEQILLLNCKVR